LFERRNIETAATVHVTSEIESTELKELGFKPRRIALIPNGVDFPPTETPPNTMVHRLVQSRSRTPILFLGRVNWKKGIDRLIPAIAHVPEAELVIAGNDEENYRPSLVTLAQRSGVAERVRFVGPVDDTEKWGLLRNAKMLVLPSYSENFGNVILEAMAVGCPVVVTPEVGLAQTVRNASVGLVVEGTPENLAAAINTLLQNPDQCRRMGEAGRRIARDQFSWAAIARKMEQVYQRCACERRKSAGADHTGTPHL